jgi:hypothetical protein
MKRITVRDEAGYCVLQFVVNDDYRFKVEHEDGRVDYFAPEKVSDQITTQTKLLEELFNAKEVEKHE